MKSYIEYPAHGRITEVWLSTNKKKNYRASNFEKVTSLIEQSSGLLVDDTAELAEFFTCEYAGCFGGGNVAASFLSMESTSDMVGLSSALSCTQRSAMFTYLESICLLLDASFNNTGSINSNNLLLVHRSHAFTTRVIKLRQSIYFAIEIKSEN